MRFRDWVTRIILIFLMLATLIITVLIGAAKQIKNQDITSLNLQYPPAQLQSEITIQQNKINQIPILYVTTKAFIKYRPKLAQAKVDPTNYGDRYLTDVNGVPFSHQPIIVLHETTNSTQGKLI